MAEQEPPGRSDLLAEEEERVRRDTDEAMRLFGEFLRRLSHQGVRDVADLARLHEQVCRAAGTIALPEIDHALAQIRGAVDRIRLLGMRLDRLAALKRAVGGPGRNDS